MSDDRNQTDDDLFDITESESSTDAASTTDTENEDFGIGEESENEVPSVKAKAIAPGEAERNKMVNAMTLKVMNGDLDLDNLPSKQKWMKTLIEQKLGLQKKEAELDQTADQIIERKLAEKDEARRFDQLKKETLDLPLAERKLIAEKYKIFRQRGLSQSDALQTAHEAAGVVKEDDRQVLRQRMAIPAVGEPGTFIGRPSTPSGELPAKEEDRLKLYADMAKSQ